MSLHTLEIVKKPKHTTVSFWLIVVGWQIKKGLILGPITPNHALCFLKILLWTILFGQDSCPNDL